MIDDAAIERAFADARLALRAALVRAGLSQRQIAAQLGIHDTSLSRGLAKRDAAQLARVGTVFPPAYRVLAALYRRLAAIYDLEFCEYIEAAAGEADAAVDEIEQVIAAMRERAKRDG
jgi:transcriptional regulator with XRE-family HTH domain